MSKVKAKVKMALTRPTAGSNSNYIEKQIDPLDPSV
jgi:hypothetical protein